MPSDTKALALTDYQAYPPATAEPDEIRTLFESLLAPGERIGPGDLQRISVPAAGGTVWTLPTTSGDEAAKTFDAIIVHHRLIRARWEGDYTGQRTPPACFSDDAVTGVGTPGGDCATCPYAQFGSGRGRAPACKRRRLIFFVREGQLLPAYLSLPPTSERIGRQYLFRLGAERLPYWQVITRFALERAQSESGIAYSRVTLTRVGVLPPEARPRMEAYVQAIRPLLTIPRLDAPTLVHEDGGDELQELT
jgi:hypothetical protein